MNKKIIIFNQNISGSISKWSELYLIIQRTCKIFFSPVMNSILITFLCNYSGQEEDGIIKNSGLVRQERKNIDFQIDYSHHLSFLKNHFKRKNLELRANFSEKS